jgi:hypothetical protein
MGMGQEKVLRRRRGWLLLQALCVKKIPFDDPTSTSNSLTVPDVSQAKTISHAVRSALLTSIFGASKSSGNNNS